MSDPKPKTAWMIQQETRERLARDHRVSPTAKAIYIAVDTHRDHSVVTSKRNQAFVSYKTIQSYVGCSMNSIKPCLNELVALGYWSLGRHAVRDSRFGWVTKFTFHYGEGVPTAGDGIRRSRIANFHGRRPRKVTRSSKKESGHRYSAEKRRTLSGRVEEHAKPTGSVDPFLKDQTSLSSPTDGEVPSQAQARCHDDDSFEVHKQVGAI